MNFEYKVLSPHDMRPSIIRWIDNQTLYCLIRITSIKIGNFFEIASSDLKEYNYGNDLNKVFDEFNQKVFNKLSNYQYAKNLVLNIDYSKLGYLYEIKITFPFYMIYEKNIYKPPIHSPKLEIKIYNPNDKHLGLIIGKDGKNFIYLTQKYKLDYIWYNRDTQNIEIYGNNPSICVSEIMNIISNTFRFVY